MPTCKVTLPAWPVSAILATHWKRHQTDRARQRSPDHAARNRRTAAMIQVEGLADRVAVVTGAGRGIGQRIAEVLAGNGAKVAALDLEAPEHDGILGIACDVSDEAAIDAT